MPDQTVELGGSKDSLQNSGNAIKPSDEIDKSESDGLKHEKGSNYLKGWKLHTLSVGLFLGLFLVNLEISIVSTSLVAITNDLRHFSQSSWVITAYLLTYTSFMIVLARFSDVYGRKAVLLFSVFLFTVFSGGCAAAKTMIQLIICRAFQGIGGSGVFSLIFVILFEMVPPARWPIYTFLITVLFGTSMTLGPIFGGLINLHTTWRWAFLLNVPGGVVAMTMLALVMPRNFPYHGTSIKRAPLSVRRIDFLGVMLLLFAMTLHITALEQAANLLPWRSAEVLAPLVISVFLWFIFFVSQWYSSKPKSSHEPVLPWRFIQNRVFVGLVLNTFLTGAIFTTCIIQIPLRYQAASGSSPLQAGIRLIPLSVTMQLGGTVVAIIASKRRLPPVYLAFFGAIGQLLGCVFMSRSPPEDQNWKGLYGLEALTGICIGIGIGVVTLMTPYVTEKRDHAVATASIVQFRFLGGATALAIATAVGNTWLQGRLSAVLDPQQVSTLFRATEVIRTLPVDVREMVRGLFAQSFNLQMRILAGFAAAEVLSSVLLWKKEQVMLE